MSVNLVLPPLTFWATGHLTRLLESKTEDDFSTAFNAMFAAECTFSVNGETVSRDEYQMQLLEQSAAGFDESGTIVSIENQTQVETGNQGVLSGLVGIFYTAVSDSKFLILGAPSEKKETSSLNLVIEPTEKNPHPPNVHFRGGYFDPRRVTSVNQVVAESTYHVTIPQVSVPKTTTTTSSGKVELGPEPLQLPPGPFGGRFGPGPVRLPPSETGDTPEMLPGDGEFGVGPVITGGETLGPGA